jgi:exopolysaccharide biosynthesis polyprenyl glycosylphosphotransferase
MDAVMISLGIGLAEVGAASAGVPPTPLLVSAAFAALVLALLAVRGMYRAKLSLALLEDARGILTTTALAAMVVLSVRALVDGGPSVAQQGVRLWAFVALGLVGGRAVMNLVERDARRTHVSMRPTLIIGSGQVGQLTARRLLEQPELGLNPIGFLDKEPLPAGEGTSLPVLGASWDLRSVVEEHGVEQVIVCFSTAPTSVLLRLAEDCERLGIEIAFVPRLFERMTNRLEIHHLGGLPLVFARRANPRGWMFAVKYAADRIAAAFLLAVVSPVFVAAAVATRVSVGRPIFFRQTRVGYDGRPFEMLKFRTMRAATGETGNDFELPPDTAPGGVEGDDRRTRVGTLLRRTSMDELPQLLNVLRGEMSIVGPRPERPEFVDIFVDSVHRYGDRHRVKAGVTGWAQVNGLRGKTSVSDRAEWDNYYIENWSLWLDIKILLMTVAAVVGSASRVE